MKVLSCLYYCLQGKRVIVFVVFVSNCGYTILLLLLHAYVSRSELQNFLIDELTAKVCKHKQLSTFT